MANDAVAVLPASLALSLVRAHWRAHSPPSSPWVCSVLFLCVSLVLAVSHPESSRSFGFRPDPAGIRWPSMHPFHPKWTRSSWRSPSSLERSRTSK